MVLITRQMEEVVIRNQVRNAGFIGHGDCETAVDIIISCLKGKTIQKKVGIEAWSSGLTFGMGTKLADGIRVGEWVDIWGMLDEIRWSNL